MIPWRAAWSARSPRRTVSVTGSLGRSGWSAAMMSGLSLPRTRNAYSLATIVSIRCCVCRIDGGASMVATSIVATVWVRSDHPPWMRSAQKERLRRDAGGDEDAIRDLGEVDAAFDRLAVGVQRRDHVIAVEPQVEGEVVTGARCCETR